MREMVRSDLTCILLGQLLIATGCVAAFVWWRAEAAVAPAVLYGAGMAAVITWHMERALANAGAQADPAEAQRRLGLSALGRLLLAGVAFAVGLGPLRLEVIPMLSTFAACQLGLPIAAVLRA